MWLIAWRVLREFGEKHRDAEDFLKQWRVVVEAASWKNPQDVNKQFSAASFVANNRVVFNIKGNRYRLVVKMQYDAGRVYVRFIGTHTEYDKINAEEV